MPNSTESPVCGIDLGTTNSCISVIQRGESQVIPIAGSQTMPSVVAYRDGEWLVGEPARNHRWTNPQEAVASIKRKMDDPDYRVVLGAQSLSPIDVSAKILRALVDAAEQQVQQALSKVVITVPAWFQESQRQATLAAGRQAGLDVIQIINEPTAAAIAHQNIAVADDAEEKWLVYDLGGGTFDVSVLNVGHATYEVLASQGNTYLGGDDFDHRLADRLTCQLRDQYNVDPSTDAIARVRLHMMAERAKKQLSTETSVPIQEPVVIDGKTYLLDTTIARDDFEGLIDDLLDSTVEKAQQALAEAGVSVPELSRLLLVGGSTRIPAITDRLAQVFGIEPESWLDPDLSVALGASVRAAIACGEVFERSVVDICPHTLGIAAVGELDMDFGPGIFEDGEVGHPLTFSPLIRRNSRLPAHFTRTFYKASEQQMAAVIAVYQGEHTSTRQNTFIGEFSVDLHNQNDRALDVDFAYDLSGTIKITVRETGQQQSRMYTMDMSRPPEENSELRQFSEALLPDDDNFDAEDADVASKVTNFLVEKVSRRLQSQGDNAPTNVRELLQRYQSLLELDAKDALDDGDALDDIEDQLYDWIESE